MLELLFFSYVSAVVHNELSPSVRQNELSAGTLVSSSHRFGNVPAGCLTDECSMSRRTTSRNPLLSIARRLFSWRHKSEDGPFDRRADQRPMPRVANDREKDERRHEKTVNYYCCSDYLFIAILLCCCARKGGRSIGQWRCVSRGRGARLVYAMSLVDTTDPEQKVNSNLSQSPCPI